MPSASPPTAASPFTAFSAAPAAQGLYTARHEHDACGVAFVATMRGTPGHDIVEHALAVLRNLDHRGAVGAEPNSGDGAGILTQIPDEFFRGVVDFDLPEPGRYAAGIAFLPQDEQGAAHARARTAELAEIEGMTVLGWREVPATPDLLGSLARTCMPRFEQVFLAATQDLTTADGTPDTLALDRLAYLVRKQVEHSTGAYFASLSSRTITYKGMLTTEQLEPFFPDLSDRRYASTLGIVHSRFSTNTFPSWPLAHPYRFIAHNGEINTVRGNRNWMHAREAQLRSDLFSGDLARIFPIITEDASDSASFDEVLELLHLGGRSLAHSVLMMIPEAWENNATMDPKLRAFYEFSSLSMEPWDGPADLVFTDGSIIGARLDRNGLRPARYWVTDDGLVVLASEAGVLDIEPEHVTQKGRLAPGRILLVDTVAGKILDDDQVKRELASEHPYDEWLTAGLIHLEDLPEREHIMHTAKSVVRRQQTFGYTEEELRILLTPLGRSGAEAIGSMGTDSPIAVLSSRPRLLFDYFTQLFAQVTNPPLDAIREELVTALGTAMGPEGQILDATPAHARQVVVDFPVIDNDELAKIVHLNLDGDLPGFGTVVVRGLYRVDGGGDALAARLDQINDEVDRAIEGGARFVVLSDRDSNADNAPIPSLLLTSAVHHHLIRRQTRNLVGLITEAGDVREVHHVALLLGYGASAVNPYLAMESVEQLCREGLIEGVLPQQAVRNMIYAMGKGVLKVMSKMGISTIASYRGAQVFEAIGLSQELVDGYFTNTTTQLGGVGIDVIAEEVRLRHQFAYPRDGHQHPHRDLWIGGEYQWRREGEPHLFDPETVFRLQHATRSGQYGVFKQYTSVVDEQSARLMTLRGLMTVKTGRQPIPIEEVEPVESIVKRFSTGAMSYGSISMEAHETLAIAMNSLGARSNTGEGGEDVERLLDPSRRSAIKQVASGRFGVTSMYLTHSDDLQIKMAQGAKPGEGGQLPAHKVYPWVARTRHSTPGVGLISPPPHHDIYSIEDLAQLIHDLKNSNPSARVHVKLVAEVGVGTVAAGVSKAHADVVLISGHDGGTGASPLTSLKHAGAPWELGLAETQQTLLLNGLRDRIVVQVDGQLKTGRDVVIAALLGAEEFGFATAPLVVSGCIMMRVCHLDTCPVGVATQNPELRKRFNGRPEFVVNFFTYIAQEVREYLAAMGLRSLEEIIGHPEMLDMGRALSHWKADGLDLSPILHMPEIPDGAARHQVVAQDHGLAKALDHQLITMAADALHNRAPIRGTVAIRNVNRTVGTMLGHEVTKRFGVDGLPDGTIDLTLVGSGGQSLGAFLPPGVTLRVDGDSNDYLAKGLCGGVISVAPPKGSSFLAEENVVAGNVIGYGATSGRIFLRGKVGERFCVRNSGASAVVEGVGDHGCEYMTGGTVVVLGPTGRNFGAGMSGGSAFVLDLDVGKMNPLAMTSGELGLERLTAGDVDTLRALLAEHVEMTGSTVASELLAEQDSWGNRFTKILPRDYARVLAAIERARPAEGDPDDETVWSYILEASRG